MHQGWGLAAQAATPHPRTARSELEDPGEAPGNLAKIIAPLADFPKQSRCLPVYLSNQEAWGLGTGVGVVMVGDRGGGDGAWPG